MAHISTIMPRRGSGLGQRVLSRLPRIHVPSMLLDAAVVIGMYYAMLNFRYFQVEPNWQAWTVGFGVFAVIAVVVHWLPIGWPEPTGCSVAI